jgi:hypothetical protein
MFKAISNVSDTFELSFSRRPVVKDEVDLMANCVVLTIPGTTSIRVIATGSKVDALQIAVAKLTGEDGNLPETTVSVEAPVNTAPADTRKEVPKCCKEAMLDEGFDFCPECGAELDDYNDEDYNLDFLDTDSNDDED